MAGRAWLYLGAARTRDGLGSVTMRLDDRRLEILFLGSKKGLDAEVTDKV